MQRLWQYLDDRKRTAEASAATIVLRSETATQRDSGFD